MGKLDVSLVQYLDKAEFKVLSAVEAGMKTHELVPLPQVTRAARLKFGGTSKILRQSLCEKKLVCYERGPRYDGYRLTNLGYDYLAVKKLSVGHHLGAVGNQIGVGKESDIFIVQDVEEKRICMKLHRLGRTCFRKLKEKRDYHKGKHLSWIFLSRVSASKEFAFMTALHEHGFPVPRPLATDRHIVLMELVDGVLLQNVSEIGDAAQLYDDLMQLIVDFAGHGVIHGDFNEFNIMVKPDSKPVIIDFPQMISTSHKNAKVLFERDVDCVRAFFKRRFNYESESFPVFDEDVERTFSLDQQVKASGFDKDMDFSLFEPAMEGEEEDDSEDENLEDSDISDGDNDDISSCNADVSDDNADISSVVDSDENAPASHEIDASDDVVSESDNDTHVDMLNECDINSLKVEISENENSLEEEAIHKDCENKDILNAEYLPITNTVKSESLLLEKSIIVESTSPNSSLLKDSVNTESALEDSEEAAPLISAAVADTIGMYFRSLRIDATRPLTAVPEGAEIPGDDLQTTTTPTFVNLPKQPGNSDNFDTLSTASKRSRRNRFNADRYPAEERKAIIAKINAAGAEQSRAKANGEEVHRLDELVNADMGPEDDRMSFSRSIYSLSSNISVTSRLKKERVAREEREMPKKYLRTKGDAHAAKRRSKECATEIKCTMECKDVWE